MVIFMQIDRPKLAIVTRVRGMPSSENITHAIRPKSVT